MTMTVDEGKSTPNMDPNLQAYVQQKYLPAVVPIVGTVKHSARKIAVALLAAPERICGVALRVGYTGTLETDLAIYRLKIRPAPDLPPAALPGFFVLEEGIFQAYEDPSHSGKN
ncbi:MAG: hypothetical protein NVS4B7_18120 [Ktedonobacteraceae bacterium]